MTTASGGAYVVYRYDFPDGSAYVGHTRRSLTTRHYQHRVQPSNRALLHQILAYPDIRPAELSRHPIRSRAVLAERAEIATIDLPLNSAWISQPRYQPPGMRQLIPSCPADEQLIYSLQGRDRQGRPRRRRRYMERNPDIREIRCRTCLETRSAEDYYSDTHRSSGIASRCIHCDSYLRKLANATAYDGKRDKRDYYQRGVDAIRAGGEVAADLLAAELARKAEMRERRG